LQKIPFNPAALELFKVLFNFIGKKVGIPAPHRSYLYAVKVPVTVIPFAGGVILKDLLC
jgi:hypothetical protein